MSKLYDMIQNNPALSQKEIAMELGWTVDRVKYYLNKMKNKRQLDELAAVTKAIGNC